MPFNGSGVYTAPAADFPVVTQTVISSTHFNNTINDIATALSTCLTKDGQQTATANINFGGFRATNVGITAIAGSVGTPAINVSDTGTGLYRSAASELAVTVAGTQRARFDSTGLIVTGVGTFSGATSTTTLTATSSVVTPAAGTATDAQFSLIANGVTKWAILSSAGLFAFAPGNDGSQDLGTTGLRVQTVFSKNIDSGTAGSLSLRTNNGTEQFRIVHSASSVNVWTVYGQAVGNPPLLIADGTDSNVGGTFATKGTGNYTYRTDAFATNVVQFQVLHTPSASRNITVTGSNGGNPTISTTAGSLAITPAVVIAGASLTVDTSAAVASVGSIRLPNIGSVIARNAANSGDVSLAQMQTINGTADVVVVGGGGGGLIAVARSGGAAPTTSDLASGRWTVWRDTGGATTKLYYNNSGTIQSVALAP